MLCNNENCIYFFLFLKGTMVVKCKFLVYFILPACIPLFLCVALFHSQDFQAVKVKKIKPDQGGELKVCYCIKDINAGLCQKPQNPKVRCTNIDNCRTPFVAKMGELFLPSVWLVITPEGFHLVEDWPVTFLFQFLKAVLNYQGHLKDKCKLKFHIWLQIKQS